MSYILDALRKSDQQRQLGATPTLHSAQSLDAPRVPQRSWLYPTLAVALAMAAFAIGWLRPWHVEPATAPAAAVAALPESAPHVATAPDRSPDVAVRPAPAAAAAPADEPRARRETAAVAQEPATTPPAEAARALPSRAAAPEDAPAPARRASEAASKRASETRLADKIDKAAEDRVVPVAELPASIRSELPAMSITVHSYSPTAKDRLLGVNNKLLREGDTLTPDLVLERITPDGMVFSYKGTRFQRGLR